MPGSPCVSPATATINVYRANTGNTLEPRMPPNGQVVFSRHQGSSGAGAVREGGEKFEIQDLREDLWLMNRKVSINQVVVEVNYVCGEAQGSVRITE